MLPVLPIFVQHHTCIVWLTIENKSNCTNIQTTVSKYVPAGLFVAVSLPDNSATCIDTSNYPKKYFIVDIFFYHKNFWVFQLHMLNIELDFFKFYFVSLNVCPVLI